MENIIKRPINLNRIRQITHSDCVGRAEEIHTHDEILVKWTDISGHTNQRYKKIAVRRGKGIAGVIYKTGKPWIVEDVNIEIHPAERHQYPILMSEKIQSFIAVPIIENNMPEGVILIGYRKPNRVKKSLTMNYIRDIQTVCQCELGGVHL
ncbi:GAF domain-containing protein [Salinicoccus sp. HZC-1]|uniref:GAF domain-containing protein n=1 Tax=Salinicoccus sp. HZC-1 TaxID=3385497 RepID=UPI00398AB43A